jgi:Bifunctional DNA primase/polymerase, N-terminal
MTGPYAAAARRYHAAGWSPLPLPVRRKKEPPAGWTGRVAPMASAADVETWCEERPGANIALRLPPGVIGIDADAHKGEAEAAAWQKLISECGPLPAAPWCTSRDDGISGIRLFTVPDGYMAADLGPAGEVIQHHHRYVVAPPSISPPPPLGSNQPYRWVGAHNGYVPNVADLPPLPAAWLNRLRAAQFQQPAQWKETSWTSPDVGGLVTGGIPSDQQQEPRLRDLVFDCVRQGMSEHTVRAVDRCGGQDATQAAG